MLEERISKTQRKNELDRLKKLGAELIEMPAGKLAMLSLPDDLRRQIDACRKITEKSARKRQLLTVGRYMEDVDPDLLRAQLAAIDHPDTRAKIAAAVKPPAPSVDPMAATLLDGGDAAVFALTDKYERDVLQNLRQLVRNARKKERGVALAEISGALAAL